MWICLLNLMFTLILQNVWMIVILYLDMLSYRQEIPLSAIALSTMAEESMAAATATHEAFWLQFLRKKIGLNGAATIVLKEDNKVCICFTINHSGNHRNSKHIHYRYLSVREGVQRVWNILRLNFS